MAMHSRTSYQHDGGLQEALVDLVRVGVSGYGSGVRQIASRLLRALPPEVEQSEAFRVRLRDALTTNGTADALRFAPGELPQDSETHALVDVDPTPSGASLALAESASTELDEIVTERMRIDELAQVGIAPTRTVLLSGPPGVGKTLAAKWLAERLGVPLVSLNLASVVSSYLGSSGRNIKAVLSYAQSGPCVLLLDEFDAVAKRRDDDTDIGELKRLVNVLLVELERWSDTSLLVAATNHPHLLDSAIHRRFDRSITLALPTLRERQLILRHFSESKVDEAIIDVIAEVTEGDSGSDLARMWNRALRRSVLQATCVDNELIRAVLGHASGSRQVRDRTWILASSRLGFSARQIAQMAQVTHPTVSAALRRSKENLDANNT